MYLMIQFSQILDMNNIKHSNILKLVGFPNTQQIIDNLRMNVN